MAKSSAVSRLRKAFEDGWGPTVRYVGWAEEADVTQAETETSVLIDVLDLKPNEAKELFDGIKGLKLATFVVGRRGQPSRLKWHYTLASIAAAAKGKADVLEPVSRNLITQPATKFIKYTFQLRRDQKIEFSLPMDLTAHDVARLNAFLQTLPIEKDE